VRNSAEQCGCRFAYTPTTFGEIGRFNYLYGMIEIELDLKTLKRDLAKAYVDLSGPSLEQATFRALNHTTAKLVKPSQQYTRSKLRLSAAVVKAQLKVTKAGPGNLQSSLGSKSAPLRARNFRPTQLKAGTKVSISPGKGGRKMIKRAFLQRVPTGGGGSTLGVFARGQYKRGQGFQFGPHGVGTGKGKMTQIMTTTVAQKLDDPGLLAILRQQIDNDFTNRLGYLLGRASTLGPTFGFR
jgi:hypothetical protein